MIDVVHQINAVQRRVGTRTLAAGEARTVIVSQSYDAAVEDVWDACTSAERIPRWFLPVSGELSVGGRYQLEGNAGGTIERCDPPVSFFLTWEFGGQVSWVEVRLTAQEAAGRPPGRGWRSSTSRTWTTTRGPSSVPARSASAGTRRSWA